MTDEKQQLTAEDIQKLIEELPKLIQVTQMLSDTFVKVMGDVADVIRAIPPELIEKAVNEQMAQRVKDIQEDIRVMGEKNEK